MFTRNRRRALETIEAAATIPVMLLITAVIVQFGFAVYSQQAVQNAANYGARMGSVAQGCRSCVAQSAAASAAARSGLISPSVSILAPGGTVGSTLKVQVTARVPNLIGPLAAFFGGSGGEMTVTSDATFRAEGW